MNLKAEGKYFIRTEITSFSDEFVQRTSHAMDIDTYTRNKFLRSVKLKKIIRDIKILGDLI